MPIDFGNVPRGRSGSEEEIERLGTAYKLKRKKFQSEICRLKSKTWAELIGTIDRDPSLLYRLVLSRLRTASPSLTEILEEDVLERLLDSLFPRNTLPDPRSD
ncbi:type-1 retrotransposable element r1dm [Lasius niger]|uniref:Type-1 retrotransposable element r1dm n=1 Tax=Lasius niger TaxID=67767 RepID=A0A0J7KDH4_LASNI|nr:type-1 retrotransposable element r1dm [Lasius niger]